VIAAQFQRDALQVTGCRLDDQLADFGRAGEGDFVDIRMFCQRGSSGLAISGDDVHHAVGKTGLGDELAQADRRKRRLFRGFEDDVHPAARRAPVSRLAIIRGKFQGMI